MSAYALITAYYRKCQHILPFCTGWAGKFVFYDSIRAQGSCPDRSIANADSIHSQFDIIFARL